MGGGGGAEEGLTGVATVTKERWNIMAKWGGNSHLFHYACAQLHCICCCVSILERERSCTCTRTHCSFSNSTWCARSWSLWVSKGTGEDIGGNCPAWFPLYISFLHKSFHPPFSLLGVSRRKSLTCLDMEHNCPKTGPGPNEWGAKLSQTGLDTKTETGAIRIMAQSPCNGQWWGNQVWLALSCFLWLFC